VTIIAPALSAVGLILIAIVTLNLLNGKAPFGSGSNGNGGNGGTARTPAPSGVVVVPDEAVFEGAIVYAKGGNIWVQTSDDAKQVTSSGGDSMPSWSADGEWIVYIHSTNEIGYWPVKGRNGYYDIVVPDLMRVRADGSAEPEELATGFVKNGRLEWSAWMASPFSHPTGPRSPSSPIRRTPPSRTSSSSSSTWRRRSCAAPGSGRTVCSVTRIQSGDETGGSCCTPKTAGTAREGRR